VDCIIFVEVGEIMVGVMADIGVVDIIDVGIGAIAGLNTCCRPQPEKRRPDIKIHIAIALLFVCIVLLYCHEIPRQLLR
jgi:hypothetical protein